MICETLFERGRLRYRAGLLPLLCGGMVLQVAAGGCDQYLSGIADAFGHPIADGIQNGLSDLVQALVLGVFI